MPLESVRTDAEPSPPFAARRPAQFTYPTVDCTVIDDPTIDSACAALITKASAAHPSVTYIGCTGECGSLVLQLQVDGTVADADILAAEAAIAADPASVAITLQTTDGATLVLDATVVVSQGVAAAVDEAVAAPTAAAGKKGKTGKKGAAVAGKKGKKGKAGTSKAAKGKRGKSAKQSLGEQAAAANLTARTQTHLALLAGLLGIVGVAVGIRKRGAHATTEPVEPTEKSPLVACPAAPQATTDADVV